MSGFSLGTWGTITKNWPTYANKPSVLPNEGVACICDFKPANSLTNPYLKLADEPPCLPLVGVPEPPSTELMKEVFLMVKKHLAALPILPRGRG